MLITRSPPAKHFKHEAPVELFTCNLIQDFFVIQTNLRPHAKSGYVGPKTTERNKETIKKCNAFLVINPVVNEFDIL